MALRAEGVRAPYLDDELLRRELHTLHDTREDTFLYGSAQALEEHTRRMFELEREYVIRFSREPAPRRTRAGARRPVLRSVR